MQQATTKQDSVFRLVHRLRLLLAMLLCSVALTAAAAQPSRTAQPPEPPAGFVPVDSLPQQEQLPAAPLVIAAYVVAWVVVFGYLWSIWQRLRRVERDLMEVSRRIAAGERR
jgi:CcmD family protein